MIAEARARLHKQHDQLAQLLQNPSPTDSIATDPGPSPSCPSSPDDFDYEELAGILSTTYEGEGEDENEGEGKGEGSLPAEQVAVQPPPYKQRIIMPNRPLIPVMPAVPTAVPIFPLMQKQGNHGFTMAFPCMPLQPTMAQPSAAE